jgi:hypothetical protein
LAGLNEISPCRWNHLVSFVGIASALTAGARGIAQCNRVQYCLLRFAAPLMSCLHGTEAPKHTLFGMHTGLHQLPRLGSFWVTDMIYWCICKWAALASKPPRKQLTRLRRVFLQAPLSCVRLPASTIRNWHGWPLAAESSETVVATRKEPATWIQTKLLLGRSFDE